MDTTLRYYGRLRHAAHCGTLCGVDVFLITVDEKRQVLVHRSKVTSEQATSIYGGGSDPDLATLRDITWSNSEASTKARAWISGLCKEQAAAFTAVADSLSATAEVSP